MARTVATATLPPGEVVSAQDPGLTVRDIKVSPSRIGHVVQGVVTNHSAREYSSVHISLDFLDAHGATVGTGRDSVLEVRPGDQWHFRANAIEAPDGSVHYKVTELSGY